jgi:hypothetical protein
LSIESAVGSVEVVEVLPFSLVALRCPEIVQLADAGAGDLEELLRCSDHLLNRLRRDDPTPDDLEGARCLV